MVVSVYGVSCMRSDLQRALWGGTLEVIDPYSDAYMFIPIVVKACDGNCKLL